MKIKKSIITLAIIASVSSMASYVTLIKDTYSIGKSSELTIVNDWVDVGLEYCQNDKETSDIYYNISFEQKETCNQDQERTIDVYDLKYNGEKTLISSTKETRTNLISENTTTKVGTHLEQTCKGILDNGFSFGNGTYAINQTGTPNVFCDMSRNGGGWMRVVNYNWYENKTTPSSQFQSTTGRIIVDTSSTSRKLPDGFWVQDWTASAASTGQRWKEINTTPIHAWSEAMVDFEGLGFRSLDGWHPSNAFTGDVNAQYMDGFSLTYGNAGSRKHLYSFAIGYGTDATPKANNLSWLDSNHFTYGAQGTTTLNDITHQIIKNGLKLDLKTIGKENISLRFMADQHVNDETIGFRKYILWVR